MESITELKKPRINDRLRVIGLCLHEDFRERVGLLLGQTQNRSQLDDPGHAKDVVYAELAVKFNDDDFKVSHPTNWKNAETELSTYYLFDPNDPDEAHAGAIWALVVSSQIVMASIFLK